MVFLFPVSTQILEKNKKIVIEWGNTGEETIVEWIFTSLNERETFVSITNSGLKGKTEKIITDIRNATEGFTLVLAGAKAYLEHQIPLNLILDRFPKGLS